MVARGSNWEDEHENEGSFSGQPEEGGWNALDEWDRFQPEVRLHDVWDAFELDDDVENPQPEYGDFWPEPDDEEQI